MTDRRKFAADLAKWNSKEIMEATKTAYAKALSMAKVYDLLKETKEGNNDQGKFKKIPRKKRGLQTTCTLQAMPSRPLSAMTGASASLTSP